MQLIFIQYRKYQSILNIKTILWLKFLSYFIKSDSWTTYICPVYVFYAYHVNWCPGRQLYVHYQFDVSHYYIVPIYFMCPRSVYNDNYLLQIRFYPRGSKLDNTFAQVTRVPSQVLLLNTFRDILIIFCTDSHVMLFSVERKNTQPSRSYCRGEDLCS